MQTASESARPRKSRSRRGCRTCRIRKIKCDEHRPLCHRCEKTLAKCEWLEAGQPLRKTTSRSFKKVPRLENGITIPVLPAPPTLLRNQVGNASDGDFTTIVSDTLYTQSSSPTPGIGDRAPRQQSLFLQHIALANSLQLRVEEQNAFLHVPSSQLVFCYASRYAGVMRGFIAIASMELRALELTAPSGEFLDGDPKRLQQLEALAQSNYRSALKELSTLLNHACSPTFTEDDTDALFAMWFLILRYEMHDEASIGASICHLQGIRSLLEVHARESEDGCTTKLPWISQNMLLYILYMDADKATSDPLAGKFCSSFSSRPPRDCLSHENLFLNVRLILPHIWGDDYPIAELLDDMENYRPLRLYHLCQVSKLELLALVKLKPRESTSEMNWRGLWTRIEGFEHEFADIVLLAQRTRDSAGKRLFGTIYSAALDFLALKVLYLRMCPFRRPYEDSGLTALQIVTIANKALEEDPRKVYRFMWAISVALYESQNNGVNTRLYSYLRRAQILLPKLGINTLGLE